MYTFLSVVYILVCLFLIMVVLLQQGRGGGMGGAFGGSSQTVFGSSGAGNFLTRLTTVSAALFMLLSATLAWLSSASESSLDAVMEEIEDRNRAALLEAASDSAEGDEEGSDTDDGAGAGATDDAEGATDDGAEAPPATDELILPGALGDLELHPDPTTGEAPDLGDLEALELELPTSLDELPGVDLPSLAPPGARNTPDPVRAEEPAPEAAPAPAPAPAPAGAEAPAPAGAVAP